MTQWGRRSIVVVMILIIATACGSKSAPPGFSGRLLIVASRVDSFANSIDVLSFGDEDSVRLPLPSSDGDVYQPVWSPDGTKIAFAYTDSDMSGDGIYEATLDARGEIGEPRLVYATADWIASLSYSPDSAKLAFVEENNVYIINTDGTELTLITERSSSEFGSVAWSPVEMVLAFTATIGRDTYQPHIYLTDPDGFSIQQLTQGDRGETEHQWSPDGSRLAYMAGSYQLVDLRIGLINRDGSGETILVQDAENFSWSPDSTQLAYEYDDPSTSFFDEGDIYVISVSGGEPRLLTPDDNDQPQKNRVNYNPVWTPDGKWISYGSWPPENQKNDTDSEIFMIDLEGKSIRQLTDDEVDQYGMLWQPDLTQGVAYVPTPLPPALSGEPQRLAYVVSENQQQSIYIATLSDGDAPGSMILADPSLLVTGPYEITSLAWSPDGTKLACVAKSTGDFPQSNFYVFDFEIIDYNEETFFYESLVHVGESFEVDALTWSPDSKSLMVAMAPSLYQFPIDDIPISNLDSYRIPLDSSYSSGYTLPEWSPDGTKVLLLDAFTKRGLWTMNPDGSGLDMFTGELGYIGSADWSPDSSQVILELVPGEFGSDYSPGLALLNAADGSYRKLINGLLGQPEWSPDGKWIIYVDFGEFYESGDLFLTRPDGTQITQLTDTAVQELWPAWQPAKP